jgi:hypothetical protein
MLARCFECLKASVVVKGRKNESRCFELDVVVVSVIRGRELCLSPITDIMSKEAAIDELD